jgi:tetratricopeptide (TPR) repeat protein
MRRARHSRATGREEAVDELFSTRGLEADPILSGPDRHFPLRPFAASIPRTDLLAGAADAGEPEAARLFRRAGEAAAKGRRQEAVVRYRELLALEPGNVAAVISLSNLLEAGGQDEDALEQLGQGLQRVPDDPRLLLTRGALLGRLKRYPEAETDLRHAIRARPHEATAHFTLGLVLWRKGLPLEAAAALRRTIELQPSDALAHYYLGEALHQANDMPQARAALERATQLDPTDARPFQLLGRILDRLKRPEEARAMYERARAARRP